MTNIINPLQQSFIELRHNASFEDDMTKWFEDNVDLLRTFGSTDMAEVVLPKTQKVAMLGRVDHYGQFFTTSSVKRWHVTVTVSYVFPSSFPLEAMRDNFKNLPFVTVENFAGFSLSNSHDYYVSVRLRLMPDEWPFLGASMLHKLTTKDAHNYQKKSYQHIVETLFPCTTWKAFQHMFNAGLLPDKHREFCKEMMLLRKPVVVLESGPQTLPDTLSDLT